MKRRKFRRSLGIRILGSAKLCPGCELRIFEGSLPPKRSYTRKSVETTTTKLCAELRSYAKKVGVECKHFEGMSLNGFLKRKRK